MSQSYITRFCIECQKLFQATLPSDDVCPSCFEEEAETNPISVPPDNVPSSDSDQTLFQTLQDELKAELNQKTGSKESNTSQRENPSFASSFEKWKQQNPIKNKFIPPAPVLSIPAENDKPLISEETFAKIGKAVVIVGLTALSAYVVSELVKKYGR